MSENMTSKPGDKDVKMLKNKMKKLKDDAAWR